MDLPRRVILRAPVAAMPARGRRDGLRAPMNAPPAADLTPGVAAVSYTPIVRANLVIISGPSGAVIGIFLYAPGTTPALGNPPIFWASPGTIDPFGNVLRSTTGIAGTGTFSAGNTFTTPSGTVAYTTATVTANNMLSSDAPAAFTDSAGNSVLAGVTTYGVSGLTYYALNQLPGIDHSGTFGAIITVYTAASQAGPWTAGAQLNLAGSNIAVLTADTLEVFGVSGAPTLRLSHGVNLAAVAAFITATATGVLNVQNSAGLSGTLPMVQVDISTNAVGNTAVAGNLTKVWSVPANDGVAGTTYVIKGYATLSSGATAAETLTVAVFVNGSGPALATLGAAFNGGALSTGYDLPFELTLIVDNQGLNTPQITLNASIADTAANRLATNSATMHGHSNTTTWNKTLTNTLAVGAQWGGAGGVGQNIQTTWSKLYREGP